MKIKAKKIENKYLTVPFSSLKEAKLIKGALRLDGRNQGRSMGGNARFIITAFLNNKGFEIK